MASLFDLLSDNKETSAKSIVGSLFGLPPEMIAQQQANSNLQNSQQAALQYAQMDPFQRANYAMFQGASGATGGILSALGAENPAVTKAKEGALLKQKISQLPLGTADGQQQAFSMALEAGRPEIAIQLRDVFLKQGLTQAKTEAALREKKGTPETQAEQVRYNQLVNALGEEQGSIQFLKEKEASKRNVAAAGAAVYGGEKIGNLTGAQGLVEGYVKKPFERLQAVGEAKQWLGQAAEGNTAAVPQLKRALVRLGGPDAQLAAREIATIAGNAGIAGNVVNAVNSFLTGTPTKEEIKLIGKVIGGAEGVLANQYMQGRQQAETVLGAAKLDPQTRTALLPPPYKLPEKKTYPNAPKTGTVQGGYRFKGGNPADQNNWEKI